MSINERDTALEGNLQRLLQFVSGGPEMAPTPKQLLIWECIPGGDLVNFRRSELRTPEQFVERFDELMSRGYAWIHLELCGMFENHGLVIVHYPREPVSRRGIEPVPTSVNFGGPPQCVADNNWNAAAYVRVID